MDAPERRRISEWEKTCPECRCTFSYSRVDNQINGSWYLYCADCGTVGLLTTPDLLPSEIYQQSGYELAAEAEPHLPRCECGGMFKRGALPRCPSCKVVISRDEVIEMLDAFYSRREWSAATSGRGCLQHCIVVKNRLRHLEA